MMKVLGISAFYHNSAAAIIVDNKIIAAVEEERFSRIKYDNAFPKQAVEFVLRHAGLRLADVDAIAFYEKPFKKLERIVETFVRVAPKGLPLFVAKAASAIRRELFARDILARCLLPFGGTLKEITDKLRFCDHHMSHAASSFYTSPFQNAVILSIDAVGEAVTTTRGFADKNGIVFDKELTYPHSLGLFYSTFTSFLGFSVNADEYKVMGLAPYGRPLFSERLLDNIISVAGDGSFQLNMRFFSFDTGFLMYSKEMEDLLEFPPRCATDPLQQHHADLAASLQCVTEYILLRLARDLRQKFGVPNLCLSGGVAHNSAGVGRLARDAGYESVWVPPVPGDAGGSIGAALAIGMSSRSKEHVADRMGIAYLGPQFSNEEIEAALLSSGLTYERLEEDRVLLEVTKAICDGMIVGWFQGRTEFGPRALGSRSILADPRDTSLARKINLRVKKRESFRPFAASVLADKVLDWFDDEGNPFMGMVVRLRDELHIKAVGERTWSLESLYDRRSAIPAVTHVDYTCRIQPVTPQDNPRYYRLISQFHEITRIPCILNTSFNGRDEPIVNTPQEACQTFRECGLDLLVIGDFIGRLP